MTPRTFGFACALSAVSIFAVQDGISKHLGSHYPPIFITMIRYWFFAVFVLFLAARSRGGLRRAIKAKRPVLQIARGVLLVVQIVFAITSFAVVGLVQAQAIFAAVPIAVACLSAPLLGEKVGAMRWLAILIGLAGVLLVIDPLHTQFDARVALPLIGVMFAGIYAVLTRLGARSDSPETAFFYTGIAGAVAITLVGPFFWTPIAAKDWIWMLILCLTGMSGHYLLIRAFGVLDAVAVQPMTYLQTVLACLIGVTVFNETPSVNTVIGSAVVIFSGLFMIWNEARQSRIRKAG